MTQNMHYWLAAFLLSLTIMIIKRDLYTISDIIVASGGCLSGAILINEGIKNGDNKADAGRAAYLYLLILEKFQEINSK